MSEKLDNSINRNYFFVFQNQTYKEESSGGYLWAPQENSDGATMHHWKEMTNIRKGDLIFHSYKSKITAISVAQTDFYEAEKPSEDISYNHWEELGWRVNTAYYFFESSIKTSEHREKLVQLQPKKYAPLHSSGSNTGYLFKANNEMAKYIITEIYKVQNSENKKQELNYLWDQSYQEMNEYILNKNLIEDVNIIIESQLSYNYVSENSDKIEYNSDGPIVTRRRDAAINALKNANYLCEVDNSHPSFLRKNTKINYTEAHYLIPLSKQVRFEYLLDVEANIISLCSTCYNQLRYGENKEEIIIKLYKDRKKRLKDVGIDVTLEELLNFYI